MLNTEYQSAVYNSIPGTLNEKDGIDCPICNNKGVLYRVDEAGCLYSRECECMAKRKSLRLLRRSGLEDLVRDSTVKSYLTPD